MWRTIIALVIGFAVGFLIDFGIKAAAIRKIIETVLKLEEQGKAWK